MNEKPNSATSMQGRRMAGARALWHANGMTREQKKSPPVRKVTFTQGSDSGAIRTHDPQLRRLLLYPAELPSHALPVKVYHYTGGNAR